MGMAKRSSPERLPSSSMSISIVLSARKSPSTMNGGSMQIKIHFRAELVLPRHEVTLVEERLEGDEVVVGPDEAIRREFARVPPRGDAREAEDRR